MIGYKSHIQNVGWTGEKRNGQTSGTVGEGLRLEALIVESDYNLRYKAHVQNVGWQDWVSRGEIAGTVGQSLRMEAFVIELIGDTDKHVWYRVHVENVGWTDWAIDGAPLGSVGQSLRIEALEIQIVDGESNEEFKKWYDDSLKCKLGNVVFSVTQSESTDMSADVTNRAIEGGTISDHISNNPLTMSMSGVIVGNNAQKDLTEIRGYLKNGELLKYTGVETATNMVITSFSTDRDVSIKGGVSFSLTLQEILIATGFVTVIDDNYIYTQFNNLKNGGLQAVEQKWGL